MKDNNLDNNGVLNCISKLTQQDVDLTFLGPNQSFSDILFYHGRRKDTAPTSDITRMSFQHDA